MDAGELGEKFRQGLTLLRQNSDGGLGDYLEFGVFRGDSLICMYRVLEEMGLHTIRLFGFDSFEGLPEEARTDDDGVWQPGTFAAPYGLAVSRLADAGIPQQRAVLVKGWFSDTLNQTTIKQLGVTSASVIYIDADIYSSSKQALDFCAPLIKEAALVVMDDWHAFGGHLATNNMGQPRAFNEFLAEHPELSARDLGSYSCFGRLAGQAFLVSRKSAPA